MIADDLSKRILILDGATGTMLQKGCQLADIHKLYIDAGADIITADTFNLKGYKDSFDKVSVACRAAADSSRKVYVAGDMGPYTTMLSLSDDALSPAARSCSFDSLVDIYLDNGAAMMDAGADLILIETAFDGLNVKAALYALSLLFERKERALPVMVSATINDRKGRLLTGMQVEALYRSITHFPILSFGLNCSFGASDMAPVLRQISSFADCFVSMHPNAGLPDKMGEYAQSPEQMASVIRTLALEGCINIAGGCCGTTPEHIAALKRALDGVAPRKVPADTDRSLWVCGLDPIKVDLATTNFVNVGERTNVAGSRKFARLIGEKNYADAALVAARQIQDGASIIDINLDDALLDSPREMEYFVRYISNDPDITKAAFMIDSSNWETLLAGIKNTQGKCIVNSISLKEGEDVFLRRAAEIHRLGAAVIVMAFDERGQATTYERKIEICARSYRLLTEKVSFAPQDIIFDVNILTVATGMAEHASYAVDFIRAVKWIKENLPGCHTSGGVSNLSFSFRGNNPVREAMHSVFLYHAIASGLDMAIVNPGMVQIYSQIDPELRKAAEDVILNSDIHATERLTALAENLKASSTAESSTVRTEHWRELSAEERLKYALKRGVSDFLERDLSDAMTALSPVEIIEGPLLRGMEDVGTLFSSGEMFLPQVIKSAKVMRSAVDLLKPHMASSESHRPRARMVLATVRGDVHDIGKNILGVVLSCNDIEIIDLGVMVDNEEIMRTVRGIHPDFVGVSGLITPSLGYMEELCTMMTSAGLDIPLFIGGATTSALHTALKLAPLYSNVVYTGTASDCANTVNRLLADMPSEMKRIKDARNHLLELHDNRGEQYLSKDEARSRAPKFPRESFVQDESFGRKDMLLRNVDLENFIHHIDWRSFLSFWGFKGEVADSVLVRKPSADGAGENGLTSDGAAQSSVSPTGTAGDEYENGGRPDSPACQALKCYQDGLEMFAKMILLKDVEVSLQLKFFDAFARDDEMVVSETGHSFAFPRSTSTFTKFESLVDFIPDESTSMTSRVGFFVIKVRDKDTGCSDEGCRDYRHLLRRSLCQRIADAAAVWLENEVSCGMRCIRPAFGYASAPDHSMKEKVFEMLHTQDMLGVRLTESYSMIPSTSICGMIIAHSEAHYPNIRTKQL